MKLNGEVNYVLPDKSRKRPSWRVTTNPHAMMWLKRIFPQVAEGQHGHVYISDTDAHRRQLVWFLDMFPMVLEERLRLRLIEGATRHVRSQNHVERVLTGNYTPRNFDVALPPRDYQTFAAELTLRTGGLLLADDLGLGKTLVGILVLVDPRSRPAMVVCPTHVQRQWWREFRKFAPKMRVHIVRSTTPYDVRRPRKGGQRKCGFCRGARCGRCFRTGLRDPTRSEQLADDPESFPDVLICTYAKLHGWADELHGLVRGLVFDEAHELRRAEGEIGIPTKKYAAAKHLAEGASVRLGLTATPVINYGDELRNVIDVLRPGALGTAPEFSTAWCGTVGKNANKKVKDPKALGLHVRDAGLFLRRTRKDVGRELPPIVRVPYYIDADQAKLDEVEESCTALVKIILGTKPAKQAEAMHAAGELSQKLRQATGIAKAPFVAKFVEMMIDQGEKVLLGGWHRAVYSIWAEKLKKYNPVFYTGSESPAQKEASRAAFVEGNCPVMIMSLRSGSGLDGLQKVCKVVAFGELDWSFGMHEQFEGRANRDDSCGQVTSYYLVTDSGTDPIVLDVLGIKRGQSEPVKDPMAERLQALTSEPDRVRALALRYAEEKGIRI